MNAIKFNPERLRKARGTLSLADLASVAGVTENTIRNWEIGKYEPDASQLAAMAARTGKSLDFFFRRGQAA
jgi:transcriptional regulator with XRE-family HTH domain